MKQYIVDIKGICILEDEWEDAKITITRNGIADTIEFNPGTMSGPAVAHDL